MGNVVETISEYKVIEANNSPTSEEKIKQQFPEIKVIIVTIHEKDDLIFKAYIAGAIDYVVKTSDADEIVKSIRAVYHNKIMLRPDIAQKIFGEFMMGFQN